jgi:tetratricopeptide (TPR) repeat protein
MSPPAGGPFCPECSKPAIGNFCQNCGAKLGGRFCNQCGGKISSGAKFCNQCGTKAGAGAAGAVAPHRVAAAAAFGGQNLAWWIAGAAMFVLIMVLGVRMVRPAGPAAPGGAVTAPAAAAGTTGTPPDISQLTPIEAADRLFGRVMTAISEGDSAQAQAFMPMALAAYDRARPLNHDGLFHLSMLNRTANNLDAALDDALRVLEEDPNHLLALAAAAEAAIELGYDDEAEEHYRRILEIYDEESTRPLPEYDAHRRIVDVLKQDAERYLAGR